ncbi:MAG: heavy-metal-associated domain-containing protein [Actinobacteria bacterium]|nr:heavy-metal-associated domain-containing protein [Actinomycetota bacterium]
MAEETYRVSGMSCEHCVQSVTKELKQLPGVEQVDVDLTGGTVTVASAEPLDVELVRGAVDEAGYELVS